MHDPLGPVLEQLHKQDGLHWLRIEAQYQTEFNEIPFWVLVRDKSQIKSAIGYLQSSLLDLQRSEPEDITVSFISFSNDKEIRYGLLKGDEFFQDDAVSRLLPAPIEVDRKKNIFDYEYPEDEYSIR